MRPRYFIYGLVIFLFGNLAVPSSAGDISGTQSVFVSSLAQKMLVIVNDKTISSAERQQGLEKFVVADFDLQKIAKFVLGRYWRETSNIQQQKFAATFLGYMVRLYAQRFTGYDGQTFKVISQHTQSDTTTIINTEVYNLSARHLASVAWRVHNGDKYKVLDMKVSGISVMRLKREEFTSYLQRNNGNLSSLIRYLQDNSGMP